MVKKKRIKNISHEGLYLSWMWLIHGPTEGSLGIVIIRRETSPLGFEWKLITVLSVSNSKSESKSLLNIFGKVITREYFLYVLEF